MSLAISTAWNYTRADNGKELIYQVKKLGFEKIELNFSLTKDIVEEITELVLQKEISVVSIHNFCPIPEGLKREIALPDYYSLASLDEIQREKAVFYSKITINAAVSLKAKAVVLHCGRNEIKDYTRELIGLFQKGLKADGSYKQLKQKMLKEREEVASLHFRQAIKSLKELAIYAKKNNISLGIENRFYYREIPSLEEIGIILNELKEYPVYYWHDTGHAKIFEDLGFAGHNEHLKSYGQKTLGLHMHNVINGVDHQSPNKGEINFLDLLPFIKKDCIKVIESHAHLAREEDIKEGKLYLEKILDGKI